MSYIDRFVVANNLRQGDAILLKKKIVGMFDHFAVYLGRDRKTNQPIFAANSMNGVSLIKADEANDFLQKLVPEKIERFKGSNEKRKQAVQRALSKQGERGYNLIFNNCEHYKNFVQYGKKHSKQVDYAGNVALIAGGAAVVGGLAAKNDNVAIAGLVGLALGAILKIAGDQEE